MADISETLCGVKFKNPFLLASGHPADNAIKVKKAAASGWGGVVLKTIGPAGWPDPSKEGYKHPRPNFWITRQSKYIKKGSVFAFENITGIDKLGKTRWFEREIGDAKDSGIPVIASIAAATIKDWVDLACAVEKSGVDMVELNTSGPYAITEMGMGDLTGKDPSTMAEVVKALKKACSIPVIPKLSPNLTPTVLVDIAKAAANAGADALAGINTVLGVNGIDIETGLPLCTCVGLDGKPKSIFAGISGSAIKPIGLRIVLQVCKSVSIPYSAAGGLTDWQDCVEFIMGGATTLQLCTGPMVFGYDMVKSLAEGLEKFMDRKSYKSISDFKGMSLKYFGKYGDLKVEPAVLATIDEELCSGCGLCVKACEAGGGTAITIRDGIAKVDKKLCVGCNLCNLVCPEGAAKLVGVPRVA
jgi:dihydropyrimidine dehydrogenase (NAD+) subunit PreA